MANYIPAVIKRVKRRSIALIIDRQGQLIVRAPLKCPDREIFAFIKQKSDWIEKKQQEIKQNAIKPLDLTDNSTFIYFGKKYIVRTKPNGRVAIKDDYIYIPNTNVKVSVTRFLKNNLKKVCTDLANKYSQMFKFEYKSISITSAKTCWGSCSGQNRLNFTYRLALCPIPVVEYIVIHELCHTKVKNHSTNFWKLVKSIYPEYKTIERWLKTNRQIIDMI
ncbi:MAG: M48 family metallopeptidase [Clostridia bacterium]|nr:M48 family metallopeptidase [Clostridia bacterium]